MMEPLVVTQEDYEMFYNVEDVPVEEGEDPFADFYVAGEDDNVSFDDGIYYLGLYVNEEYMGDIETQFEGDVKSIKMEELNNYIGGMLTTDSAQRIFGDKAAYLSLDELKNRGITTNFDSTAFALYMTLDYTDLSVRVLSVTTQNINRRDRYALSGATELKPAKFSWVAAVSLYGSISYPTTFDGVSSQSYTMYVSNSLNFLQLGLDFSYSIYNTAPYYSIGNWTAFHDFIESNQRLTFGSVGSNLSARTPSYIDTNIGFTMEKSYSYGAASALGNQFQYSIDIIEPSNVKIFINPDETTPGAENTAVFDRTLQAGSYRLKDFVFTQGSNRIRIVVTPESHPQDQEIYYVDTSYDSRLLGKGDALFGYGASIPRGNSSTEYGKYHFWDPVRQTNLSYFPTYMTARFWENVGLTDTFTFAMDVSATPGVLSSTFNGVWANKLGTTQFQTTFRLSEMYKVPVFSGSITERLNSTVMRNFGSLSLTFSATAPATSSGVTNPYTLKSESDISGKVAGSFSFSSKGLLTKLRYTITGSVNYTLTNAYPTWSTSLSTGLTPLKGLSLSASMTVSGSNSDNPGLATVTATISGSYAFTPKLSASTSTTMGTNSTTTTSAGISYRPNNTNTLSLTLSSFKYTNPLNHTLMASWSHIGDFYTMTLRQQVSSSYKQMTTSLNLSTAFAFADWTFGMARSIGNTYLMVKPEGELRHSQIAVARSMDSSPQVLKKYLGSALFNSISPYVKNNVVVYGGGEDSYSTSTSLMYQFQPRGRNAYVVKIDLPPTFTISGILRHGDGTVYEQYSSPVYHVVKDESGVVTLEPDTDLYLFTDQEGRYIISDIKPGDYSFDIDMGDGIWHAVRFTVPEMKDKKLRVIEFQDISDNGPFADEGLEGYDQTIDAQQDKLETEEVFWNKIFPDQGGETIE